MKHKEEVAEMQPEVVQKELETFQIAHFVLNTSYRDLPPGVVKQLKIHLLDSIGSLINALSSPTIYKLAKHIGSLESNGKLKVPASGNISVDRAAQFYTALVRYPDFMDNFLGKEATCHPSDNIGSLLAVAQMNNISGKDFLTAMAIAYEIECRLVEEIPVMVNGFDHTALLGFSLTASLSKLLSLTEEQTAHALGIVGTSVMSLVSSRSSYTYEWKGFASSLVALNCMNIVLMAKQDITGPLEFFEGPKGFNETMEMKLKYDWNKEDFSLIEKCILKTFNAEVHTQSAIEAALEIKNQYHFTPGEIEQVDITTFLTCYHIVGNGNYGDRTKVHSKEQADHSMPYLVAVALLDDEIYPEQFLFDRINRNDVQELLQKVKVHTKFPIHKPVKLVGVIDPYTSAYPDKLMAKVEIKLKDGRNLELEKEDYHGFHTKPLNWTDVANKFNRLTTGIIDASCQHKIKEVIAELEKRNIDELMNILKEVSINDH